MKRTILIFAYYSFKDPVFQSAVLPYFINFPQKEIYRFILLTFEQNQFQLSKQEKDKIRKELSFHNITWYPDVWHSGFLKLLKKIYDLTTGIIKTLFLVRKHKVVAIYSEGFPGAIIAHFVAKFSGKPHIIHTFEPHADYMIESGVWKKSDWEAKVQKYFEKKVARGAFAIMTATRGMMERLQLLTGAKLFRVPSCVDLAHFKFLPESRQEIRAKYGISDEEIVIVYLGKLGGMYMDIELFDFFKTLYNKFSNKAAFRFMLLTIEPYEKVDALIKQSEIPAYYFIVKNLARQDVPGYLSAADIAFCGIRPIHSRRFSSPIKNGEYWACGLPIIIPSGISESYLFVETKTLGWCLPALTEVEYETVGKKIIEFGKNREQDRYRKNAREFAEQDRSVKKYQNLYHQVFQSLPLLLLYFCF